jgi:hypothetical protein
MSSVEISKTFSDHCTDGQPPKRRGPKPDSKPALTRRQELNRQAQRFVPLYFQFHSDAWRGVSRAVCPRDLSTLGQRAHLLIWWISHWVTTGHLITPTAASRIRNLQAKGATTIAILASDGSPCTNKSDSLQDASRTQGDVHQSSRARGLTFEGNVYHFDQRTRCCRRGEQTLEGTPRQSRNILRLRCYARDILTRRQQQQRIRSQHRR